MARTADQIVSEQLGALHLQLVIAQSRAEHAEELAATLATQVHELKKANGEIPEDVDESSIPDGPTPVPDDLPV